MDNNKYAKHLANSILEEKDSMSPPDYTFDDAYLDSFESIYGELKVISGCTTDDEQTHGLIAKTLLKLPNDVREKTIDEVLFIFGSNKGEVLTISFPVVITKDKFQSVGKNYITHITQPVIMLNFEKDDTDAVKVNAIAHEIAHFYLGHLDRRENMNADTPERIEERQADDLAEKWGFERSYKNV